MWFWPWRDETGDMDKNLKETFLKNEKHIRKMKAQFNAFDDQKLNHVIEEAHNRDEGEDPSSRSERATFDFDDFSLNDCHSFADFSREFEDDASDSPPINLSHP